MKKTAMIVIAGLLVANVGSAAPIVWGSNGTGPNSGAIVDFSGTVVPLNAPLSSFVITMYNVTLGLATGISTDFVVGNQGVAGYFGTTISDPTPYSINTGNSVNTRIDDLLNNRYVVLSTATVGDLSPTGPGWTYGVAGCNAGDWVLVPEPGVIGLFALGMITLGVARIRRKK